MKIFPSLAVRIFYRPRFLAYCAAIALIFTFIGCTDGLLPNPAKPTPTSQSEPQISGVDIRKFYEPVRRSGVEDTEAVTTVVFMKIADYEKIKSNIRVYNSFYSPSSRDVVPLRFSSPEVVSALQTKYPGLFLEDASTDTAPNIYHMCVSDYRRLQKVLTELSVTETYEHENLYVYLQIEPKTLKNIPPEMIIKEKTVRKNGFLIYNQLFYPPYSYPYWNRCLHDASPEQMLMTGAIYYFYDPTLYSLNLPSELAPSPVAKDEVALYLIKLRTKPLVDIPKESVAEFSVFPQMALDYDLSSNASPHSLIVVSTTEEKILQAKEAGIVWWYERYLPAYKTDVRKLYDPIHNHLMPQGDQKLVTVQVTFHMPEGVNEKTVTEKREELKKLVKDLGVPKYEYGSGHIVGRTQFAPLDTYKEEGDKYFGTDYVEPREGVQIPWEKYAEVDTFSLLLPQFPLDDIKELLKREDIIHIKAESIGKEGFAVPF